MKIRDTIAAVLVAGAVILMAWTGWSCWSWVERANHRLDRLDQHVDELELQLFGEAGVEQRLHEHLTTDHDSPQ